MAKYKVWLTVKDSYGNTKELDGGDISVNFEGFTQETMNRIEEALPLEDYLKKTEADYLATDTEVGEAVDEATANTVKYSGFKFRNNTEGAGK